MDSVVLGKMFGLVIILKPSCIFALFYELLYRSILRIPGRQKRVPTPIKPRLSSLETSALYTPLNSILKQYPMKKKREERREKRREKREGEVNEDKPRASYRSIIDKSYKTVVNRHQHQD